MANLITAKINSDLIKLLKEITIILRNTGKKVSKEMVCNVLVHHVRYNSNILEYIKNEK